MTRSRQLTVAAHAFKAALTATVAAQLAAASQGPRVIENKGQALPKGAQQAIRDSRRARMAKTRAAAQELVAVSNQTLVVAHLHPRWLRLVVENAMDKGAEITLADVERMRAAGPSGQDRTLLCLPKGSNG